MTLHWQATGIEVHKVVVGPYENNVFTIRCTETGEALLIDAANEHEQLLELCQTLGVRTVVETHGHWDHIQAIPAIRDAGYEVGVAAEDATMLPSYDFILEDDSVIQVGRLRVRTIHNPGHTPGSMSFFVENTPLLFQVTLCSQEDRAPPISKAATLTPLSASKTACSPSSQRTHSSCLATEMTPLLGTNHRNCRSGLIAVGKDLTRCYAAAQGTERHGKCD